MFRGIVVDPLIAPGAVTRSKLADPTDLYEATTPSTQGLIALGTSEVSLLTLNVPAGKYALNATTQVINGTPDADGFDCVLVDENSQTDIGRSSEGLGGGFDGSLAIQGSVSAASADTIDFGVLGPERGQQRVRDRRVDQRDPGGRDQPVVRLTASTRVAIRIAAGGEAQARRALARFWLTRHRNRTASKCASRERSRSRQRRLGGRYCSSQCGGKARPLLVVGSESRRWRCQRLHCAMGIGKQAVRCQRAKDQ